MTNPRPVKVCCPTCGGTLDQGTADQWTCQRSYCGDEWEPVLADWRLTSSQREALLILATAADADSAYDRGAWQTSRNDPASSSIASGSAAALMASDLAERGLPGYVVATELGRALAAQIRLEADRG